MADQTDQPVGHPSRRGFFKGAAGAGLGLTTLLAGCEVHFDSGAGGGSRERAAGQTDDAAPASPGGKRRRLRAAFSNGGLSTTWCKLGYDTAMLWGDLLDVEIGWLDGELNPERQRDRIEGSLEKPWDFCVFQALQIGALAGPVRRLKQQGIPVVSIDTLLVERPKLRDVGVWVHVAANHEQMAEASTRYLMKKIGGKGRVIHIGGDSAHSGAQDRKRGFDRVLAEYPEVEVVGGQCRWCDWKTEKARDTFDTLLQQSRQPIAGAFFHNDDMALASLPALKGTRHEGMVVTAVDGQKDGLTAVRDGRLAATAVNPSCMIHQVGLIVGQFIVRNQEKLDDLPVEIMLPTLLVSKEAGNLESMFYMSDPKHCLI
jgi:ribose transport system substrate-binding protein